MIRREQGFTLPEVLIALSLMVVVMLATLATFDGFTRNARTNERQNDIVEQARLGVDHLARQLRNLANPTNSGSTIDRAEAYDFIFQTSDPSKRWVRYCLSGSATNGSLEYAVSSGTTLSAGMTSSDCPGSGWVETREVAQHVVNRSSGGRPLFEYSCATPLHPTSECPVGDASKITLAKTNVFIDVNPGKSPAERRVASGVYLRNQNEPPTASFTVTPLAAPPRTVLLNASASDDPEGRTLKYYWWKGSGTPGTAPSDPCLPVVPPTSTFIGEGVALNYEFPQSDGASVSTSIPITLVVKDPGCLSATTPSQAVTIP
jgi:prepilin-type N-terminal cleavage/methylation domain-containing protein